MRGRFLWPLLLRLVVAIAADTYDFVRLDGIVGSARKSG